MAGDPRSKQPGPAGNRGSLCHSSWDAPIRNMSRVQRVRSWHLLYPRNIRESQGGCLAELGRFCSERNFVIIYCRGGLQFDVPTSSWPKKRNRTSIRVVAPENRPEKSPISPGLCCGPRRLCCGGRKRCILWTSGWGVGVCLNSGVVLGLKWLREGLLLTCSQKVPTQTSTYGPDKASCPPKNLSPTLGLLNPCPFPFTPGFHGTRNLCLLQNTMPKKISKHQSTQRQHFSAEAAAQKCQRSPSG